MLGAALAHQECLIALVRQDGGKDQKHDNCISDGCISDGNTRCAHTRIMDAPISPRVIALPRRLGVLSDSHVPHHLSVLPKRVTDLFAACRKMC